MADDAPAKNTTPPKKATAPKAAAAKPDLPEHKDDLAALAISRGVPSYEAWAMTVAELKTHLEA